MAARTLPYRKKLPRYNTALGVTETLAVTPPFSFQGVTARVFPLRARMNSLRNFCDRYLNVAPEVCEFRPYLPYVLLVVLDYGRMAVEEFNLGWISQNEVFFGVPLAMWRRDRLGRPVFDKWVVNTPFIVVDDARSLSGGRESYGWPKVLGTLQSTPERWLIDPRNPTRFLSLDVRGADSEASGVRLLDIEQQSGQNAALVPPDLEMIDPFASLSRWARTSWTIGSDLAQILLGAPLSGFGPRCRAGDPRGDRSAILFESLGRLPDFLGEPGLDVVTLKQFRGVKDPTQISYQALVKSRLSVARYNRGGFLGSCNILQGDISGGFRIRLHDNPAFPVVESFGLEVAQEKTFRTPAIRRQTVSLLEPFFPFWMSVDLNYGKGETVCWRTRTEPWHVQGIRVGRKPRRKVYYNTIAGGAEQVWHGPFYLPEASFDVYPLRARSKRLQELLNEYLSYLRDRKFSFQLLEPENGEAYVLMFASTNRTFSEARSGAYIQSSELSFYVPFILSPTSEQEQMIHLATPFAFVDNPVLATTMREVQGVPAVDASIEASTRSLRGKGALLKMQVDVFEALGAGLPSQRRTLIEIQPCDKGRASPHSATPLAIEAGHLQLINGRLTLRQFRDTEKPDHACHQSLVFERWHIVPSTSTKPIERLGAKRIVVYQYPSLPLVQILGLVAAETLPPRETGGAVAHALEVGQPFRIEASVRIETAREVSRIVPTRRSSPAWI